MYVIIMEQALAFSLCERCRPRMEFSKEYITPSITHFRSLTARLRQMGSYGVAGCRPALAPDTVKPAHLLTWDTIEV